MPGCDPARAIELLRPVSALRSAAVYAEFVANIEPTERAHHRYDIPEMLEVAIRTTAIVGPFATGVGVEPDSAR